MADDNHVGTPYDRVALKDDYGAVRQLTRSQFEALPLAERVRAVLQKRLQFFSSGREISIGEALKNY